MQNTGTLTIATPSDCEIVLTRIHDAPRHLVFEALTRPEVLRQWFGPRGWFLSTCEVDLQVGGGWRFMVRAPDGSDIGMRGTYHEIAPPGRIVNTESFDAFPVEAHVTTELIEQDGRTTLTATVVYPSRQIRDGVLASGMEHGAAESHDKLAEYLAAQGAPR